MKKNIIHHYKASRRIPFAKPSGSERFIDLAPTPHAWGVFTEAQKPKFKTQPKYS
jgi:hypothetical protein